MQRDIGPLKTQKFDLLICGGGIYGAWTAYDAALRGLKVALIDRGDWANGTSSASSKLIHGGLRYLETFDFKLVRKALSERGRLLKNAPHRVWPLRFGIPVYPNSRIGTFRLQAGLTLYDCLAGNPISKGRHRRLSRDEFLEAFPCLSASSLQGGFSYLDAQTDDARLVLELIDGAISAGAVCVNYCELSALTQSGNVIDGGLAIDRISLESFIIDAKILVDTAGRWSNTISQDRRDYRLSKGVHLVMPKMLHGQALLLTARSDGRVFFMIPWYGRTLLGTTDSNFDGDIDKLPITAEEITYLLTEANHVLGAKKWSEQDIVGKFAGVRVLQPSTLANPTSISRDWSLQISPNGLISSIGGKLTSAREDAATIVDFVCKHLSIERSCLTASIPFPWVKDTDYPAFASDLLTEANSLGIDEDSLICTLQRHGRRTSQILANCRQNPALTSRINPDLPFIFADLAFCARTEMTVHLDDLIRRRMPLAILAKLSRQGLREIAELAAGILGWDETAIEAEMARCGELST